MTLATSAVGIGVNFFHPERIPLVAERAYETLVPCPVPGGEVTACEARDPLVSESDSLLIDARRSSDFQAWHLPGAINIVFNYVESVPPEKLTDLSKKLSERRARRIIVYGDGKDPDTGEHLGRELSGEGFKNVFFIKGGAPALQAAPSLEGQP